MSAYDSHDGITAYLSNGLAGLHDLAMARRDARARGATLAGWIVWRRFWLDEHGQISVAERKLDGIPAVCSVDDPARPKYVSYSMQRIPSTGARCTWCGEGWTLRNAHDVTYRSDYLMHAECGRFMAHAKTDDDISDMLESVGWGHLKMRPVPNRYGSDAYLGPWFQVDHPDLGRVTIGWRHHVINISWERGPDGTVLFAGEAVTVGPNNIHAYGYDKAADYLCLLDLIGPSESE